MDTKAKAASAQAIPEPLAPAGRLDAIDFLRGLVVVIMALDHTRDFFTNLSFDPEDLGRTWTALFFTRWITHFCAPLFFFLAGIGAYLYGTKRSPAALTHFLWTRGLWLVLLEFTVIGFAWTFVFPWGFFGVIWALGASMILLAWLSRLPVRWVAVLSLAVVFSHDLFDGLRPAEFGAGSLPWSILHIKGAVAIGGFQQFVLFPLIPLCAVMALGYAFGVLLQRPDRRRLFAAIGIGCTLTFLVLRLTNLYGNPPALPGGVTPGDFHLQPTFAKTLILFLDTEKYPPSLQFLLMTLGPSLLLLAWLDGKVIRWPWKWILVFGRVPLFFYLLHLYVIHLLALLLAALNHQPYEWLLHGGFWFFDIPNGYGYGLAVIYCMWLLTLVLLYFPCRAYMLYKAHRSASWLSYL